MIYGSYCLVLDKKEEIKNKIRRNENVKLDVTRSDKIRNDLYKMELRSNGYTQRKRERMD